LQLKGKKQREEMKNCRRLLQDVEAIKTKLFPRFERVEEIALLPLRCVTFLLDIFIVISFLHKNRNYWT
jgi:hypothetical protein